MTTDSPAGRQDQPAADAELVRRAYAGLAGRPGGWVALADLRAAVPIADRERVDRALRLLAADDDRVRLEPEPFGHRIGARERAAAIHLGGEDRHKLSIAGPERANP